MIIRGREFTSEEIQQIKDIVAANPSVRRRQLSILICKQLDWRQPNGSLKDRACRDVLLRLAAKEIINLPAPLYTRSTQPLTVYPPENPLPEVHLQGKVDAFGAIRFDLVSTLNERKLWNHLIDRHHYLGVSTQVGRHLKLFVYLENHLVGAMAFADAVLKLNLRDQWIGWNPQLRSQHLQLIINNIRFLILPSVKVKNLASKILAMAARTAPSYWQQIYGYRPIMIETFIEKNRFKGSSYRAANWKCLGETIGKARSGMNYFYHGVKKDYYIYPLAGNVQQILSSTADRLGDCQ